jgi:high-affinity iron transporter
VTRDVTCEAITLEQIKTADLYSAGAFAAACGGRSTRQVRSMSEAFFQAAIILLREGLEAMLVIVALAAYLTKAGAQERLTALYSGASVAIVASLLAAWLFATYNNGEHSDLVEGATMLVAAGLMRYVSGWLMVRQDPRAWQAYLKQKADTAMAQQTGIAVALLAFLAVFREGAETVLFIHALAGSSGGWTLGLIAGLVAGTVGLVVLFIFINAIAQRVPMRPLFIITSAFLFVMALRFIGAGIQEFQEQVLIPSHIAPGAIWLLELGLNPTWEAVLAQGVVVVLAIATFLLMRGSGTRKTAAAGKAS